MKSILLDTNAYAKYRRGDTDVFSYIIDSELVYLSVVVIGELFAGFHGEAKFRENKEQLESFMSKSTVKVLTVGLESAEIFGEIKNALKRQGTPIPINDVWVAAQAIETGSKLITYDEHFKYISGVRLWENIITP